MNNFIFFASACGLQSPPSVPQLLSNRKTNAKYRLFNELSKAIRITRDYKCITYYKRCRLM